MSDDQSEWKRLHAEVGPDLKLFRARWDLMRNPRNGKSERMIILQSADSVNVVALTADQQLLFVRQYRFGIEDYTLELPGGIVDSGEEVALAARRELQEETGYAADEWTPLGRIGSNPVFMDSYIHHYLAYPARPLHKVSLDDGEDVELVMLSLSEVSDRLWRGEFQHPHTVNALVLFFGRQGGLLPPQADQ